MQHTDLAGFRELHGWTRRQLADLLNESLDRHYTSNDISRWERGARPLPQNISGFLDELADGPTVEGQVEPPPDFDQLLDSPPPPPASDRRDEAAAGGGTLPFPAGNAHLARVCEELWELIATGVGMVGAVTGSEALREDGKIIHADKEALGRAWGKLAQTNATFARMLEGMTTSGAWLEVAMVSGITAGRMMRSHQAIRDHERQVALQAVAEEEQVGGSLNALLAEQAAA